MLEVFREIINVYGKQQRAQYAPLWDVRYDREKVRVSAVNGNTLTPVAKISLEPSQQIAMQIPNL